jgi:hypothetical protein
MYKAQFYFPAIIQHLLVPDFFFRSQLRRLFESIPEPDIPILFKRVNRYNQLLSSFSLPQDSPTLCQLNYRKQSAYYYDLRSALRYFPPDLRFHHLFGDVVDVPQTPAFVKCRPLTLENNNSVLLKLNSVRHYRKIKDRLTFNEKIPRLLWRGQVFRPWRQHLVVQYYNHPSCNIGQVNEPTQDLPKEIQKKRMSIYEQLRYKFILSVEGNDIATNLKWIAQSNSLCFMPKPKFESWFLENDLEPGVHYVQIQDDFSDIPEKVDHYVANPSEAQHIIQNFQAHQRTFAKPRNELLASLLTMAKYFHLSGQFDMTEAFPEPVHHRMLDC